MPVETRTRKRKREEAGMVNLGDFPLEFIQEIAKSLDPKDVMKLMMTNKRLYSFYANDPSIVFGEHVHAITFHQFPRVSINKLSDSPGSQVFLDFGRFGHLQAIKRIDSCEKLVLQTFGWKELNDGQKTILRQLKLVNELEFEGIIKRWHKFFPNFRASIKKRAELFFWDRDDGEEKESMKEQLGHFIETHLSVCEEVILLPPFYGLDCFHACYNALSKTQIKLLKIASASELVETVVRIVKHGIPSQNPRAGFYDFCESHTIPVEIVAFLTNYPGMQRIHGDDRLPLFEEAKKLWGENFYDLFSSFNRTDLTSNLDKGIWYFRRRIDSAKDCVYILKCADAYDDSYFFAYYVPA